MPKNKDYLKGYYLTSFAFLAIISVVFFIIFGVRMILGYEPFRLTKLIVLICIGIFFRAMSYFIYRSDG
ncbi:hypothetical protein DCC35_04095 [Mangrovivirga cuniculi]|uniref:Uncharacterized protein n=1 Tax=Mangrovivirga cuniculi TaxID=2715131 RepID=A0A4D7JKI5_9BACT|nr:hypothetical protein DCC35_04095 [Mangrovivirga cuniculi]